MTVPLFHTLDAMDELVREQDVPVDHHDAAELFDMVHRVGSSLDGLHDDLAECLGPIDTCGRCTNCGRLVADLHRKRGCAMAIPVVGQVLWLIDGGVYSLPFIGKALWLAKRRRVQARRSATATSSPAPAAAGTGEEAR